MNESLCFNCSVAGCFLEKSRWCVIEQVCQEVKCKLLLCNCDDWILSYIRTYRLFFSLNKMFIITTIKMYPLEVEHFVFIGSA